MRRRHLSLLPLTLVTAVTLTLPTLARAQRAERAPAEEQLVGTTLTVIPQMLYEGAVLRVAGPDAFALTKRFGAGEPITVDLLREAGPNRPWVPEGVYSYEVIFIGTGDRQLADSGEFRVTDGSLVATPSAPTSRQVESADASGAPASDVVPPSPSVITDPEDIMAGSGMAVGSTTGNPDEGEIQLHRATQETVKGIRAFESNLSLRTDQNSFFPDLSLDTNGGVALGSGSPQADFDVRDLDNNDNAAFRLTVNSGAWAVAVGPAGNMVFSKVDPNTGGSEFFFRERNHPDATMEVEGHVRGTSFKSSSSAALKTGFEDIDAHGVLGQLDALPVTAWRYKTEGENTRHIGPTAEDFQRLLGLGDGQTIATVDADGVLFAAVQALKRLSDERAAEIAALRAEVETLKSAATGH